MGKTFGIILIIVGLAMLVLGGSFSFTKKEKIIDAGPIEISANKKENINWPPYAGGLIFIIGAALTIAGSKKS